MHKITITQRSTGRQMDSMRNNLRERYKTDVNVQRLTTGFESGRDVTKYWIHVAHVACEFKKTWKEAQDFYKRLMRR